MNKDKMLIEELQSAWEQGAINSSNPENLNLDLLYNSNPKKRDVILDKQADISAGFIRAGYSNIARISGNAQQYASACNSMYSRYELEHMARACDGELSENVLLEWNIDKYQRREAIIAALLDKLRVGDNGL